MAVPLPGVLLLRALIIDVVFPHYSWAAGTPAQRRIMDPNGMPITEPILLNGNGQPLKLGDPPVYVTWSIYPEVDFRILNDFIPVVLD